ncbi:hypothetical protein ALP45_01591 [Pseudomonas coronafaciens pv. atropurpurea]|nr:Uncharacterized protein ALO66_00352 [Pseudomonas coronafaciens pv. atropurpurea]RMT62352.1 hypothetical protein ALP45_01591 [Pseudomonas coronafaciens pv. atropurpurea]
MKMTNEVVTQALQYLVGSRYVPTVKAYISEITGFENVVGPGDVITLNINPMRLQVKVDTAGLVSGFIFG